VVVLLLLLIITGLLNFVMMLVSVISMARLWSRVIGVVFKLLNLGVGPQLFFPARTLLVRVFASLGLRLAIRVYGFFLFLITTRFLWSSIRKLFRLLTAIEIVLLTFVNNNSCLRSPGNWLRRLRSNRLLLLSICLRQRIASFRESRERSLNRSNSALVEFCGLRCGITVCCHCCWFGFSKLTGCLLVVTFSRFTDSLVLRRILVFDPFLFLGNLKLYLLNC